MKPRADIDTQCMPHFDSLEQEAFLNLWRTYDRLKGLEEELFSRFELSAQQYNALRLLRSAYPGSMSVSELGRRLISRAPDMTRLLDRLEQRGLVRRDRTSEDRRAVRLTITTEGLRLLDEISAPLADCHRRQLGHMPRTALRRLISLLREARTPHESQDILQVDKSKSAQAAQSDGPRQGRSSKPSASPRTATAVRAASNVKRT